MLDSPHRQEHRHVLDHDEDTGGVDAPGPLRACGNLPRYRGRKYRVKVDYGGITFKVDSHTNGRNKPYRVKFRNSGIYSKYWYDIDGVVHKFEVGADEYKIRYRSNGELKKVKLATSSRTLAEDGDGEADEVGDGPAAVNDRRLYSCSDCKDTWETLRDYGVASVCDLVGYGSPLLSSADTSIGVVCNTFGEATNNLSADSVCDGECECVPPLTIALEWFQDADLDLRVVEPAGGETVNYENREGVSNKY